MVLNITTSRVGEVVIVRLKGAILFGVESASLCVFIKDLLNKTRQIVLDLTDVTRIDSGGLGTLVALFVSARKVATVIKLANPGNHAYEALRITRLSTVFEIFASTEDAVASFKLATGARTSARMEGCLFA